MECLAPLIVMVDRDAATLAVCDELLRSVGYATRGYQTAREAQRVLPAERPNMILMDLDLEWHDAGWDLLWLLRREKATAAMPVLIWSVDRPRLRARQRHQQTGPCHFLEKPFSTGQLLTAVQCALALVSRRRSVGL
jgi:two-component system, OmpR family, alkaline phosphatase synthesis response regulator PhoP